MTGRELKKKIQEINITVKDLADKLNMSPQALNTIFNVADVKSGTLEKIADVLKVNMSFFYPESAGIVNTNNIHSQRAHNISNGSGNINEAQNSLEEVVVTLKEHVSTLKEHVSMLKEQNVRQSSQISDYIEVIKSLTKK